jgi:galactokinase
MIDQHRIEQLTAAFEQRYGARPSILFRAPARINIIGEHVDYVSYLPTSSLAFGSHENGMVMLVRPSNNGLIRGDSTNSSYQPFTFDLNETAAPQRTEDLDSSWREHIFSHPVPRAHWSNYIRGAAAFVRPLDSWRGGAEDQQRTDNRPPATRERFVSCRVVSRHSRRRSRSYSHLPFDPGQRDSP